MKTNHAFHLDTALAAWRRSLEHRRGILDEDLDELEQHIRDQVISLVVQGWAEESAFREARRQMGDHGATEAAYREVYWGKLKRKQARARHILGELAMLKNYLHVALRNLRKQAAYSFINIGGLALGLACAFMIVLYVQHERSYDRFHENEDRLYRLIQHVVQGEYAGNKSAIFAAGYAPQLKARYPEIEAAILFDERTPYLKIDGTSERIGDVGFIGREALHAFTFPLLRGNPETALESPYSILLTESAATSLFGREDPIGRRITYNDDFDVTVTGILKDVPANTHLQFNALVPIELMREVMGDDALEDFTNSNYYLYLLLAPGTDPEQLEEKLYAYRLERAEGDEEQARRMEYVLQPITDIHFTTDIQWDVSTNVDIRYIYLFSGIALLILLIAGVNFMNLATARATQRAREVGVRKAVGAHKGQLVWQFLGESVMLSGVAIGVALLLTALFLPAFRAIIGSAVSFRAEDVGTLALLVGIGLLAGLLAGTYPAFYLSAFRPATVLKGEVTRGNRATLLRKGLIVLQFGISVFLIISTISIYNQIHYMRSKKLGFAKEQVIFAPLTPPIQESYDAFRQTVLQNPNVLHVAQAGNLPGRVNTSRGYNWPGQSADEENGRSFYTILADYDYLTTLGLELVAGRDFSRDMPTDFENAYILNETAVRELGWSAEEAVGQPFRAWDREMGQIIGVVQDFHYQSLHQQIGPVVINIKPWISYAAFRLTPENIPATVDYLQAQWQRLAPGFPFDYRFLDEDFDRLYRAEEDLVRLFTFFAGLAIFVACLGLFGLAAYSAEQRTKEIGIRKVLGASTRSITLLLSKEFTLLVSVAFFLAAPVAFFVMRRWLADFAYRIEISGWVFLLAGVLALTIAWLTVSYQSIKAALADPVKSLRYQ